MTEAEKNEIVGLVMTQISSQAVDFDIATEQPQANDLLTAVRQTSSGEYMGVTLKWDDVARIATELANQAAKRAEQAETDANNILTQVQSKGTDITNFVATSKTEIETQKDESVNAVKSVYQTDLDELKSDLDALEGSYKSVDIKSKFASTGGIVSSSGELDTNTYYMHTEKVKVYSGWDVIYKGLRANSGYTIIAFYGLDGVYRDDMSIIGTGNTISGKYTASESGYVIVTCASIWVDGAKVSVESNLAKVISKEDTVSTGEMPVYQDIAKTMYTMNGDTKTAKSNGGILYETGIANTSGTVSHSDAIKVEKGCMVQWRNIRTATDVCILAFFDKNKQYIKDKSVVGTNAVGTGYWTAEEDGYIIISCRNNEAIGTTPPYIAVCLVYSNEYEKVLNTVGIDYMQTGVERIYDKMLEKTTGKVVAFCFNTDQHLTEVNDIYPTMRGLKAMSLLSRKYPLDLVCLGGDACPTGSAGNKYIMDTCAKVKQPLYDAPCIVSQLIGNHEGYTSVASTMPSSAVFSQTFRSASNNAEVHALDEVSSNGYMDVETAKIRYIFFDSAVGEKRTGYTSTDRLNAMTKMLSGIPEGYKAVIFSHHPLVRSKSSLPVFQTNGLEYSDVLTPYADKIICVISGHVHVDASEVVDGILYISTTLAYSTKDGDNNYRMIGTEEETAWDAFLINQTEKKIYAFRYGYGADREWSYELN